MAKFDFVTDQIFRLSLESDLSEVEKCIESGAWKAVLVLSGSIIETILIDYLASLGYKGKSKKELFGIDLAEAISICKKENIITQKAADLSSAIRGFRNLIHPGRVKRLEEAVDDSSAKIAVALIDIIAKEVSKKKKSSYGHTAEQILSKIELDPSADSIIKHILKDTKEIELERLLLEVLPSRYFYLLHNDPRDKIIEAAIKRCYRIAYDISSGSIKKEASNEVTKAVREESKFIAETYLSIFFIADDLKYINEPEIKIIVDYIIDKLHEPSIEFLSAIIGITKYLDVNQVDRFITNCLAIYLVPKEKEFLEKIEKVIIHKYWEIPNEILKKMKVKLDYIKSGFESKGLTDFANKIQPLLNDLDLPF